MHVRVSPSDGTQRALVPRAAIITAWAPPGESPVCRFCWGQGDEGGEGDAGPAGGRWPLPRLVSSAVRTSGMNS